MLTRKKRRAIRRPQAFPSDKEILEAALKMFKARELLTEAKNRGAEIGRLRHLEAEAKMTTKVWHDSVRRTADRLILSRTFHRHRLDRIEREILAALVLGRLGLLGRTPFFPHDLIKILALPSDKVLETIGKLMEHGRLYRAELISFEEVRGELDNRPIVIADSLYQALLVGKKQVDVGFPVRTEAELFDYLARITLALSSRADALDSMRPPAFRSDGRVENRGIAKLVGELKKTLSRKPRWALSVFWKKHPLNEEEQVIFLALLGKELGHLDPADRLFSGKGLARAASTRQFEVPSKLRLLSSTGTLVAGELIQPSGGVGETISDDTDDIGETEFELTQKSLEMLGLHTRHKTRTRRNEIREPKIALDQLVLSEATRTAINMALTHARCQKTLIQEWGIGGLISYGRNVTLLFYGPPGTGKTACAEALARELGKSILVVNYAEIQNCFVGQTEKNIVRAFNEAKRSGAVLFWDEADAMFYDRDSSFRNWEVRDVNVLLQELEWFDGICVLATNRRLTLDKALERRITLKVEFERPNEAMRRQIWQKLLPRNFPLGADVNLDKLSRRDLSGGEIKNVVLNAARLALQSRDQGPVRMEDFLQATEMEVRGKWNEESREPVGFAHSRSASRSMSFKAGA